MTTDTYNGWSNYETWAVKLWIDNEYAEYLHWQQKARQSKSRRALADQLKVWVEENNPLIDANNMYTDLLGAALSDVNWWEIAGNMLEEIGE